jgi:prevent-host-death family protein
MTTVNALKIRNQFGEVLKILDDTGEPVLVNKGRELRAVLISVEDFKTRFIDKQAEEEADRIFNKILEERSSRISVETPEAVLRRIRGYED